MSAAAVARALLLPPLGLFLLAAFGWGLQRWWPRAGRLLTLSALSLLLFLCTGLGAGLLVRPLERMSTPLASARETRAQAIVVLAGGRTADAPEYGGRDVPDIVTLARLRYAAKLQHETGLPILVSGGNVRDGASKAEAMAVALREDFATPVRWIEGRSEDTAENALFSTAMLRQDRVSRILLVTDAMHMPRARMAFARAGLEVVAAPTLFLGAGSDELRRFLPNAESLRRAQYAIHEWAGLAWYRARYAE